MRLRSEALAFGEARDTLECLADTMGNMSYNGSIGQRHFILCGTHKLFTIQHVVVLVV